MQTDAKATGGKTKRTNADCGQTLLEFALLLPFLLLLGTGTVELGRAIFYTRAVNNAAVAGAQYGAQSALTMVDVAGMQRAATTDANFSPMSARATYGCTCDNGGGTPHESCTYPVPGPPTVCNTISCPTGQIVQCVEVTTQATFDPMFHFPGLPSSYQANGRAVLRVRR